MTHAPLLPSLPRLDRDELIAAAYLATSAGALRAAELAAILRLERVDTDAFGFVTLTLSPEALAAVLGRATGFQERGMGKALAQLQRLGWLVPTAPQGLRLTLPASLRGKVARHLAELEQGAPPGDPAARRARRVVTTVGDAS